MRGTRPFATGFDNGRYVVFIALTVEDLSAIFCTGTEFREEELKHLLVIRPDGSVKEQLKGEVNVVVVDLQAGDFCADPSAVSATGTGRVVANDSDSDLSGHGADVGRIQVTATVTDASGQEYHLTAIAQGVISPASTPEDLSFLNRFVRIHLTPIGGERTRRGAGANTRLFAFGSFYPRLVTLRSPPDARLRGRAGPPAPFSRYVCLGVFGPG